MTNLQVFTEYWGKEYSRRKVHPESRRSMRNAFERLLLALGKVGISHSGIEDLQSAVDGMKDQRRGAMCLNILLKFHGRKERVYLIKQKTVEVSYLMLNEVLALPFPSEFVKTAVLTSFGTGVRFGELFSLVNNGKTAYVASQRYKDWSIGTPKRGIGRHVPIVSVCAPYLSAWDSMSEDSKKKFRKENASQLMREIAGVTWHSLRHSYAIHLLTSGFSLEEVAKSLGNSIAVCERYYSGYVLDEVSARRLADRI